MTKQWGHCSEAGERRGAREADNSLGREGMRWRASGQQHEEGDMSVQGALAATGSVLCCEYAMGLTTTRSRPQNSGELTGEFRQTNAEVWA